MANKLGPLPPSVEWEILPHCEGAKAELVQNALIPPFVTFIVCRGCGKKMYRESFDGPNRAARSCVEAWNREMGEKNGKEN